MKCLQKFGIAVTQIVKLNLSLSLAKIATQRAILV